MNDNEKYGRIRGRTLLIVEGNHEKNKFFHLLFQAFPELNIAEDSIWIYGTNIYILYQKIVEMYGEKWHQDDIDLPFLISCEKNIPKCYKNDFTNIFLVFDYERHDPLFTENKIIELQRYFSDSTDVGKLYINYPMLESYQDIQSMDDYDYIYKSVPASIQNGSEYKNIDSVRNSFVKKTVNHIHKMKELLKDRYEVEELEELDIAIDKFLKLEDEFEVENLLRTELAKMIYDERVETAVYQIKNLIEEIGYGKKGTSYFDYIRKMFQGIISLNIKKALFIQTGKYEAIMPNDTRKEDYMIKDELLILQRQNEVSRDKGNGFIWVLNTCIFLVVDYKYDLLNN